MQKTFFETLVKNRQRKIYHQKLNHIKIVAWEEEIKYSHWCIKLLLT